MTVERAEFKPIELRVDNDWGLTLGGSLLLLTRHYCDRWLAKVSVSVDFDVVGFLTIGRVRDEPEADLFIRCEDDALQTFFWRLLPLELSESLTGLGTPDAQIIVRPLLLGVKFLTRNDVGVSR